MKDFTVLTNIKKQAIKSYFNDLRESGFTLTEVSEENDIPTKTLYNIKKGLVKKVKISTYLKLEVLIYDYLYELNPLEIIFPKQEHEDIVPQDIINIDLKISYLQEKNNLLMKLDAIEELQNNLEESKQSNEAMIEALEDRNEKLENLVSNLQRKIEDLISANKLLLFSLGAK